MITRQEGFLRLAREYVAMQNAPREPGVFSELYVRGYEAAVETALDRQDPGRTVSWVRDAYERAMDDTLWLADPGTIAVGRRSVTVVTLLQFEWGLYGEGHWEPWAFDVNEDMPEYLQIGRLSDIIGHDEWNDAGMRIVTTWWRCWPEGWEEWIVSPV